jgi:hypothetical protein
MAFSKLGNQLKTWESASACQQRPNSLSHLAAEHELVSSIDFGEVILH